MFLPLYGQHNVLNALGVAATALDCGIEVEVLKEALETFEGVQRRFTRVGDWQGGGGLISLAEGGLLARTRLTSYWLLIQSALTVFS
jgi:UDP-N-acetylmuramate-alanine ligase